MADLFPATQEGQKAHGSAVALSVADVSAGVIAPGSPLGFLL